MKLDDESLHAIARAAGYAYLEYQAWLTEEPDALRVEQPRDAFLVGFTWGVNYLATMMLNKKAFVLPPDNGGPVH